MFQTVRHWWGSGRGRVTARLFAFEFVVVMAGVLAAQGLQGWAVHRSAVEAMEQARIRMIHEQSNNLVNARAWQVAIPCLDQRMQIIMRAASAGAIDPTLIDRPKLADFVESSLDDQSESQMRARYGDRQVDGYQALQSNIAFAASDVGTIVHSWGRMSLGDPRLGAVSDADRGVVRTAAADIRAELRGLGYALGDFMTVTERLHIGIPDDAQTRPARTCAEVWQSGSVAIPR